jgi:hypothetical protein
MIIWSTVASFWIIPIVLIVSNPEYTRSQMDFENCYFRYSFEYVICVDLIAYIMPICLMIYFQASIYVALKKKKNFVNPILNSLQSKKNTPISTENITLKSVRSNQKDRIELGNIPSASQHNMNKQNKLSRRFSRNVSIDLEKSKAARKSSLDELKKSDVTIISTNPNKTTLESLILEYEPTTSQIAIQPSSPILNSGYQFFKDDMSQAHTTIVSKKTPVSISKSGLNYFNQHWHDFIQHNHHLHNSNNNHKLGTNLSKNRKAFRTLIFVTVPFLLLW